MKYKATAKFDNLTKANSFQGLGREVFYALRYGKTVECKPPKHLIDEGYIKPVQSKEKK